MNLADVMDQLGDRLETISGLRVYRYPSDNPQAPAAIVSYPTDSYVYDETYGRGMDRISDLPVIVLVGRASDRASRDHITAYVDGSGARSIKATLEADEDAYSAFDTIRVTDVEFDLIQFSGVDYLGATFSIDIAGTGA